MKTAKDYIIFPLDVPSSDEAIRYVRLLKDHVGLFKVGLELFISQGPVILKTLAEEGAKGIFLDLKLHDIPATVSRAFQAAAKHYPAFITVHCGDGEAIRKAAALENLGGTKILAITVLTSVKSDTLSHLGFDRRFDDNMIDLVLLRAKIARNAGCHGVVCSGREVAIIKQKFGDDLLIVAPGIRPSWGDVSQDDQARIVTPQKAVSDGANYIVVGRPIRDAQDPAAAAQRIAEAIAAVL